jgi:AraC-like DNA-binding protein
MTKPRTQIEDEPGVQPVYLRLLLGLLRRQGLTVERLQAMAGLAAEPGEPAQQVPVSRLRLLVRAALDFSGRPWLGLELGAAAQPFSHGALGMAAAASGSARQALELLVRFVPLQASALRLALREERGLLVLEVDERVALGEARRFVFEALLVMLESLLQALTGRDFAAALYRLPWPEPSWSRHYRAFLAGKVCFDADRLRIELPASLADAACLSADPQTLALARQECERRLAQGAGERDLLARLRRRLWSCEAEWPDAAGMAASLDLSLRSFHRALAASGLSWRRLLDEVRCERARQLLVDTGLPVARIALRLGYADPSNFSRCFRRWTAQTPQEYRRCARAGRTSR